MDEIGMTSVEGGDQDVEQEKRKQLGKVVSIEGEFAFVRQWGTSARRV